MEMFKRSGSLVRDERGATAIEYALIASLIAIAALTGYRNLGGRLDGMYGNVSNALN